MIPEDTITKYLNALLGNSQPGATIHNLLVAAAPSKPTALGTVAPADLKVTWYAIAPVEVDPDRYAETVIMAAMVEQTDAGLIPHFVGLAVEAYAIVDGPVDEQARKRARELLSLGQLHRHPDAVEVTVVYAACRDGRRWLGQRIVTGPRAGEPPEMITCVGRLDPREAGGQRRLIRSTVGLGSIR